MNWEELCEKAEKELEREPRLIRLPSRGKAVFVGDTHGDLDATKKVLRRYLKPSYRIVFLGDYVDRGEQSEENLQLLLETKLKHPEDITLLAGNHEGFVVRKFYPANYWESLPEGQREMLGRLFSTFPLAATSSNGLLALHGALPELGSLEEINQVKPGDDQWERMIWGDFVERNGEFLGEWGGRPQWGGQYFKRMMERYQLALLIRSHQPNSPPWMFNKSCITIFTSHAYLSSRTIASVDLEKERLDSKDVALERI
jgi:predicted MPP superfamily phosphohydrolase